MPETIIYILGYGFRYSDHERENMRNVQYIVNTGVNFSHIKMNCQIFDRLRDAKVFFENRKTCGEYSANCGNITRLYSPNPFSTAETKEIAFYDHNTDNVREKEEKARKQYLKGLKHG